MSNSKEISIVFIGAGRVANALGKGLSAAGMPVAAVFSPGGLSASAMVKHTGGRAIADFADIPSDAALCIISVPDKQIPSVISNLKGFRGMVVHTAGSVDMNVFRDDFASYGVLYPLQTFTKGRDTKLNEVPFLIEASDQAGEDFLVNLAGKLSPKVTVCNSLQRSHLHLSAVFASNFTNHMVAMAKQLSKEHGIDSSLLDPLIRETFEKMTQMDPLLAQTGPALRGDTKTMELHQLLLEDEPLWKNLYIFISQNIAELQARQNKKNGIHE